METMKQNPSTASTLKDKIVAKMAESAEKPAAASTEVKTEAPVANETTAPEVKSEEIKQESTDEALKAEIRKQVEADLRKQFSQLGRREQQLKIQLEEMEHLKKIKESLKTGKKIDALNALGINYDDLTSELVNGALYEAPTQQSPKLDPAIQELLDWKKKQEATQMQQVEAQAKEFIKTKAAELDSEFVLAHKGGLDAVYSLANQRFTEDGEVDIEEVIKEVEQDLHDSYFASFLETKKAKALLEKRYQEYVDGKVAEKANPRTLTSAMTASAVISDKSNELIPQKIKGTREGLAAGLRKAAAAKKK